MAEFVRRRKAAQNGASPAAAVGEDWFQERYPAVFEYMVMNEWEPGQPRQTTTVLLFTEDGLAKACVHDRDEARVAFLSAGSFGELLDKLNLALREDDLDWRAKPPTPQKRK